VRACGAQRAAQAGKRARKSVTWADQAPAADGFHFSGQRQARRRAPGYTV